MEEITEEEEVLLILDDAKPFLDEVKALIQKVLKMNKKVEYKSDKFLILSLKDELHGVFEVYSLKDKNNLIPKLIYIGDKRLRTSYLLNLINKEEGNAVRKERYF